MASQVRCMFVRICLRRPLMTATGLSDASAIPIVRLFSDADLDREPQPAPDSLIEDLESPASARRFGVHGRPLEDPALVEVGDVALQRPFHVAQLVVAGEGRTDPSLVGVPLDALEFVADPDRELDVAHEGPHLAGGGLDVDLGDDPLAVLEGACRRRPRHFARVKPQRSK